jgi:hypothetical protein
LKLIYYQVQETFLIGYDTRPSITLNEKEIFLNQTAENEYIIFLQRDNYNEYYIMWKTEKEVRLKDTFLLTEVL